MTKNSARRPAAVVEALSHRRQPPRRIFRGLGTDISFQKRYRISSYNKNVEKKIKK